MLYWAEGSKSKEYNISEGVIFSNSDPLMINLFLLWLKNSLKITPERITFDIYIHEHVIQRRTQIQEYWANKTGFPIGKFDKIYFKKDKIASNRKNRGSKYNGLLRVKVKKSTDLNRKISALIEAIVIKCGVV